MIKLDSVSEQTEQGLKPCPFCGGEAYIESCDRIINIGCRECKFHLHFNGVLTTVPHGNPVSDARSAVIEYYNPRAHKEAAEAWNRRSDNG